MTRFVRCIVLHALLPAIAFCGITRAAVAAEEFPPHLQYHVHEKMMDWETTLLCARLFLGRLPSVMPGGQSDTPERIALGKRLYFERAISINRTQSCNDCHLLNEGRRAGAESIPTSKGALGGFGKRNSPTVINSGFQIAQFWDGRAVNLFEQAKGPILNPVEMCMKSPEEVIARLKEIDGYKEAFSRAFPGTSEPMTYDNLAEAIAAFERTLIAPGDFDKMLDGQKNAMSRQEKRGLTKIIQFHCTECHYGVTVGGRIFEMIGAVHPYSGTEDQGRYEISKKIEDRFVFKVPMLRNVTRTAPYFNDGKVQTIEEAVRLMGWHQLGVNLRPEDVSDLVAFLGTLEGDLPPVEAP